ncbi:MAG: hypothetical protein AAFP69_08180, partial [Planctomycetota bacterium]
MKLPLACGQAMTQDVSDGTAKFPRGMPPAGSKTHSRPVSVASSLAGILGGEVAPAEAKPEQAKPTAPVEVMEPAKAEPTADVETAT